MFDSVRDDYLRLKSPEWCDYLDSIRHEVAIRNSLRFKLWRVISDIYEWWTLKTTPIKPLTQEYKDPIEGETHA
jgi:hypothetical protein